LLLILILILVLLFLICSELILWQNEGLSKNEIIEGDRRNHSKRNNYLLYGVIIV